MTARALEQPLAPYRGQRRPHDAAKTPPNLEDVFIHLQEAGADEQCSPLRRICAILVKEFIQMRRDRLTLGA